MKLEATCNIWAKVFKNERSKICGTTAFKKSERA